MVPPLWEGTLLVKKKGKGMVLYSAVSSPLDRSNRLTLSSPGRPVYSDTVLGFSWKHSSHAAIAQRLFTHISTTVYSQVLIYTAESTDACSTGSVALMDFITNLVTKIIFIKSNIGDPTLEI